MCGGKVEINKDKEAIEKAMVVNVCALSRVHLFPESAYTGSWGSIFQPVSAACQQREMHLYVW